MTKGDKVYTSKLKLVLDPRAPYNEQDRRQQFDLAMKLYKSIERMSFAVDSMVSLRDTANARAAKLPVNDPLRNNVQGLSQQADALRSKIVATKEGGAITGEERIREYLTTIYADVNNYDGKPTNSQVERTDALGRELDDVIKELDQLTAKQLSAINSGLQKKKLEPIQPLTQQQWEKMHQGTTGSQPGMMMRMELAMPSSMPRLRRSVFVTKRSSPTSWILSPSSSVIRRQPLQSSSANPSSIETIGYCRAQSAQNATISSDDLADLSDFLKTYLPVALSKNSLAAGSSAMETSTPSRKPACFMASSINSMASTLALSDGAKPPSSPTAVL